MKSKLRFWIVFLVAVAVLIILIWPMAPLWQRLGLEMKCVQGTFPHLKLVSCSNQPAEPVMPVVLSTPDVNGAIPIIVDDDGSPDGMIALMYFLQNPLFDVRAVTISYGEAHPQTFAPHIARILAAFGRADIPVGFGDDSPLEGSNSFPESWRQASDGFWDQPLPEVVNSGKPVPAVELIIQTINDSERPVTVFISGGHTNLAEALDLDPGIVSNIRDVFIMGGSVYKAGNIHSDFPDNPNEMAEWNIWVDPLAASKVFNSGLSVHLVPLDATSQIPWSKKDLKRWDRESDEGKLAGDLAQWMLDVWSVDSIYIWDLVAAVQTTMPEVCPETLMGLEIVTSPGLDQGRTQVTDRTPNVLVCLNPDSEKVKGLVISVFQQP